MKKLLIVLWLFSLTNYVSASSAGNGSVVNNLTNTVQQFIQNPEV